MLWELAHVEEYLPTEDLFSCHYSYINIVGASVWRIWLRGWTLVYLSTIIIPILYLSFRPHKTHMGVRKSVHTLVKYMRQCRTGSKLLSNLKNYYGWFKEVQMCSRRWGRRMGKPACLHTIILVNARAHTYNHILSYVVIRL